MAKAYYMPKIPMWRGKNLANQRELIKGGVGVAAEGRKRQSKKKGKWQEGCLDGNAAAAAFSGAGLCLGKLPHSGSAPHEGPCAQQLDTLRTFF